MDVAEPLHVFDGHAVGNQRLLHARDLGGVDPGRERVELGLHVGGRRPVVELHDDGLECLGACRPRGLIGDRSGSGESRGLLGGDFATGDLGADVIDERLGRDFRHSRDRFELGHPCHGVVEHGVPEAFEVLVVRDQPVEQVGIRLDEFVDGGVSGDVHRDGSSRDVRPGGTGRT